MVSPVLVSFSFNRVWMRFLIVRLAVFSPATLDSACVPVSCCYVPRSSRFCVRSRWVAKAKRGGDASRVRASILVVIAMRRS